MSDLFILLDDYLKTTRIYSVRIHMIPKHIHQSWKTADTPPAFRTYIESWIRKNPGYEYTLWTDETNAEFVYNHYPQYKNIYDNLKPIIKCDFVRYLTLYTYGGIYADIDMQCFQGLDALIDDDKYQSCQVILTEEHPDHAKEHGRSQIITNWFFACVAKSNFIRDVINTVVRNARSQPKGDPLLVSGPFMLTDLYNHIQPLEDVVTVLDYHVFNPIPKAQIWAGNIPNTFDATTLGMHYYVGTWWRPQTLSPLGITCPCADRSTESEGCHADEHPVFTIVTPTTGRRSLLRLKQCLRREKTKYVHLVLWDHKRCEDALTPEEVEDERTFCYVIKHPFTPMNMFSECFDTGVSAVTNPNAISRADVWLRALGITMARTKYIKCCDDDTWPEENHLQIVHRYMEEKQLDFTWCFRRMWKRDGTHIGVDRFEATGELNAFGYTLLDNSSLFYNQKAANILRQVFMKKQIYGDDRYTSKPLHDHCKGERIDRILTNHCAQPELENFFSKYCSPY
jgi:hypothetical protein